ncbi:uncharacterized protein DUF4361 [Mucilaginibacter frigoritolerans]|uniref:Uncharacterized protein DUF4361 n=1 Tax=Mucilaginibacter frigoritolerans TaxID=652788 RepID=A0A562TPQ5_9SPHI|nr:DUF1735 domain-containing protein [Mucilaginibacter frigoritolerans]TWI95549.1 uncharacterized protein DUF4361 [Mucilaginibacter frigoritolerans]
MKTKLSITKKASLYLSLIILAAYLFTSCKKNNQGSQFSGSLGFPNTGLSAQLSIPLPIDTVALPGTATDVVNLQINLSVSPSNLLSPVSATIVPDTGALNIYNAARATHFSGEQPYRQLPASLYTIQNGGKVTINPGQKSVTVGITFAGNKIDFFNNNVFKNALSLKIINAQGAKIDSSLSRIVLAIKAKSVYAGLYQAVGKAVRTDNPNDQYANYNYNTQKPLSVVTPVTVQTNMADVGDPIYLTINADNTVSINFLQGITGPFYADGENGGMVSFSSLGPYSQTGVNKYDPATKTFTLNYQYFGGIGSVSETLTFIK